MSLLGPGDDAAVLAAADGRVVASTELLVEGGHFRRDWSSAQDVGHKAAGQGLADIAAMGAVPTAVLVGLAAPPDLAVSWVEEFTDGLTAECALAGAVVVGGDVARSAVLTLAVTVLGDLAGRAPVTRSGARPGEVVAVTGRLGWSAAGLAVLTRGFRSPAVVVSAHRRPEPPYAQGPVAAGAGASAMCDVSEGMVQDLGHIATASGVGIEIDSARLDVGARLHDVCRALGVDPLQWVLTGGEDHALVATFPSELSVPTGWRSIGRVVAGEGVVVFRDGVPVDGSAYAVGGWDHFR
ncbi:thiamine-phosphate kinase [soil metagenome]